MKERPFIGQGAIFDGPRDEYRYHLWRIWDETRPPLVFIMLNPSTADAEQDDPTVRRCIGFARRWGYGRLEVLNLFALRATDPRELYRHPAPIGAANDECLCCTCAGRDVVAAWGAHGALLDRGADVAQMLRKVGAIVRHLGRTRGGHPRHPLYLRGDAARFEFSAGVAP